MHNGTYSICECKNILMIRFCLHQLLKDHYANENLGVGQGQTSISDEDLRALKITEETNMRNKSGHREIALLWKDGRLELPSSFQMVFKGFFFKIKINFMKKGYALKLAA